MEKRCASITLVGRPNSGKSSLVNRFIGQKISIVTHKVQTTRNIIRGIYTDENFQLIFHDTPGIFTPKTILEKTMLRCAWSSIAGSDLILLIIDISKLDIDDEYIKILNYLSKQNCEIYVIFNKIDKIKNFSICDDINHDEDFTLLDIEKKYDLEKEIKNFSTFFSNLPDKIKNSKSFFVSAKKNIAIDILIKKLKKIAPKSEWMYDKDDITTAPSRFLAMEITREQIFKYISHEIPYGIKIEHQSWENKHNGDVVINQNIMVQSESHKKIILGDNGAMIKKIGKLSRQEISKTLGINIHLYLFVKVRKDWDKKAFNYDDIGLKDFFAKN